MNMRNWLSEKWCDIAHSGGRIERDGQGRINWRCACGRWSDSPVSQDDERKAVESSMKEKK